MHLISKATVLLAGVVGAERVGRPVDSQTSLKTGDIDASISFGRKWDVLGPFQIGTREAAWGADPLEYYGGFPSLQPDEKDSFKSSLTPDATVKWSTLNAPAIKTSLSGSSVSFTVDFEDVDWVFFQQVYGWSALQWQGWTRGSVHVSSTSDENEKVCAQLYTPGILEYAIDSERFFGGDFYGFKKSPHVLWLEPGEHLLDVRLVRDIRAMGGVGMPSLGVNIELRLCEEHVEVVEESVMISDVLDGKLPSPYVSVDVRNNGVDWIEVMNVIADSSVHCELVMKLLDTSSRIIAPGQTRPVVFELEKLVGLGTESKTIDLSIHYRHGSDCSIIGEMSITIELVHKSNHAPHKLTHLHPSGVVSHSILLPPSQNVTCTTNATRLGAPVMLQLHGAGVEVDSPMIYDVIASFPPLCAWLLFPSGVTPWSADDWHVFGFADVLAAIASIPDWIGATGWEGIGADTEKWFVGGHSNGGQGAWYTLLHHPDRVIAASPLSGYTSIENYVPYNFWHSTNPKKKAIVESARCSYRHELLVVNAKGIPILQQHGGADDNVPAYHSRLMSQLLEENNARSVYHEVAGAGHWWDGVVTTDALKDFYIDHIAKAHQPRDNVEDFEIVVANPVDTGSKNGLRVLYLEEYGALGRVNAKVAFTGIWNVETENVIAFEWERMLLDKVIVVDGSIVEIPADILPRDVNPVTFCRSEEGRWSTKRPESSSRDMNHFGGIEAIMRTNGPVTIVAYGNDTFATALQVSRNLHNYFYADSTLLRIESGRSYTKAALASLIAMSIGVNTPAHLCSPSFPISICSSGRTDDDQATASLSVSPQGKPQKTFPSKSEDVGALFLRPLQDASALELVIWGSNAKMLAQAARLAPTMTGIGAPDWIILQESAKWRGVDGCAMGFFDAQWRVGMSSFSYG